MTTPTDRDEQPEGLFDDLPQPDAQQIEQARAHRAEQLRQQPPRLQQPNRAQVELRASDLESLLPEDHRARLVWDYVSAQDLSGLIDAVRARGSAPGRAAIDPRILFALWLYATLEGVGSGREVDRLSREHDAYRWICGGVSVNYHVLNDFRSGNARLMDELLTTNLAALAQAGAIDLRSVAHDGMRVRADAGAASFRREASLQEHLRQAGELVQKIKRQVAGDPAQASRRAQAARERAVRERQARVQAALDQLPQVVAVKRRQGKDICEARASTTDAQARVMKMADGGFRPAYNVQLATDCHGQVIVGMAVVNTGSDMGELAPMVEQVEQRLGRAPAAWLVDGGFPAHEQIEAVAERTEVHAPVPEPRQRRGQAATPDKHEPKPDDSEAVAQWRQRMATPQAKALYKLRAATAECVNALARNRGLWRMPVRGLKKVRSVVGLYVLAHNLMRMAVLAPQLLGRGSSPSAIAAAPA